MPFWWIVAIVVMLVLIAAVSAYILSRQDNGSENNLARLSTENTAIDSPESLESPSDSADAVQAAGLPDDSESLWISPTEGKPIDCRYLLPGSQLILNVRVADLRAHAEGDKLLAALGPWGEQASEQVSKSTGIQFSAIETLTLGIRTTRGGRLEYSLRLRLLQPFTAQTLAPGCFMPEHANDKLLVWCSPTALQELKGQGSEPPLFSRELQRVLNQTDGERIATLAFAGKFLQISGEKFLVGAGEQLRTATVDFLGDEATASLLSAHWGENFFLELQSTVALNERPHRFAAVLAERVVAFSDRVENAIFERPVPPYGRKVLARFPAMLRKLGNYTRAGEADKLSLLRCYLPVTAGHNLLTATELLLNSDRLGEDPTDDGQVKESKSPQGLTDRLSQSTSLVFPKETLERALEMLSEAVDVPIQIAGRDLQLEGITKNQSLALDLRDLPADQILLAILLRANPDRTATGPSDSKQKLVYVVCETANGQPGAIVVTTRAATERRGEILPDVFQSTER